MIDFDRLLGLLNTLGRTGSIGKREDVDGEFNRKIPFSLDLTKARYHILWYANIAYLYAEGDMQIPFDDLKITGSWPNGYKTSLQFYYNGQVCCILPIEEYNP